MGEIQSAVGLTLDLVRAERQGGPGLLRRRRARLAELVSHVRVYSPYFRERYADVPYGPLDPESLPVTSKAELMSRFDDWVTDHRLRRDDLEAFVADPALGGVRYLDRYFICRSSGTSGHPGIYVVDPGAIAMIYANGFLAAGRMLRRTDLRHLLSKGLREASVIGDGAHFAGAGFAAFGRREHGNSQHRERIFPVQRPLAETVAGLNAFDPAMVMGYPSAIRLLARERTEGRLRIDPGLVATAGESVSATERHQWASVFGAPVFDAYASSECLLVAVTCSEEWHHYRSDWMVLEPVDASHRPVPPGVPSHSVLLTDLTNRTQPIIRYDLGDSVLVRPDRCPCGSPLPAVRVIGRRDDVLRFRTEGSAVDVLPLAITADLESVRGLARFQLVQSGPAQLTVRLRAVDGRPADIVWEAVAGRLRSFLGAQGLADVTIERDTRPPDELGASGKFHQVVGLPAT
jgi:phenylacetate-CoA ligase